MKVIAKTDNSVFVIQYGKTLYFAEDGYFNLEKDETVEYEVGMDVPVKDFYANGEWLSYMTVKDFKKIAKKVK